MKIFYIAVHEQHAGWGAEWFLNQGFVANGHETHCLDYRKYRAQLAQMVPQDYDLLFLQRGDGFPIDLLESVNKPRFFWASELLSRRRDQERLFAWGKWDHVFVHSDACLETIVQRGWLPREKMSVLLAGYDSSTHYSNQEQKRDIDVLFIGSMTPRRQAYVKHLNQRVKVEVQRAFGPAMADYFRRAKIVLNIHAEDHLDVETRLFETLGCGAFILTEKLDTFSPFESGKQLVEVGSQDEMADKILYYLQNEKEREMIANTGHMEAIHRHSYQARAADIADVFQRIKR